MNSKRIRSLVLIVSFALSPLVARAEADAYAQVIKERDSVLTQIISMREARYKMGLETEDAINAAQLALYSFRRDVASSAQDKIMNQELIVKVYERKLANDKAKNSAGVAGAIDILLATDSLLQAKQVLEKLKLGK